MKNIIFITIDALNAEILSDNSVAEQYLPNVNRLKKEGVYFSNVFTTASFTEASMATITTSSLPLDYGGYQEGIKNRPLSIAEHYQCNGYTTMGYATTWWLGKYFDYQRGFDNFHEIFGLNHLWKNLFTLNFPFYFHQHQQGWINKEALSSKIKQEAIGALRYAIEHYINDRSISSERVGHLLMKVLNEVERQDCWSEKEIGELYIQICNTGSCLLDRTGELILNGMKLSRWQRTINWARSELGKREALQTVRLSGQVRPASEITNRVIQHLEEVRNRPIFLWVHYMDGHQLNYKNSMVTYEMVFARIRGANARQLTRQRYLKSLRYIDSNVGRLMDSLRRQKLLDDSYIVITSDHGRMSLKYNFPPDGNRRETPNTDTKFRKMAFSDENLHVPLIIWGTKCKNSVRNHLVSSLDISPTIASLNGFYPSHYFDGVDVMNGEFTGRPFVTFEHTGPGPCEISSKPIYLGVRTNEHKFIYEESNLDSANEDDKCFFFELETGTKEYDKSTNSQYDESIQADLKDKVANRLKTIRLGNPKVI